MNCILRKYLTAATLLLLVSSVCLPASAQIYQDDFNDNVINSILWEYTTTGFGPTASEINQRLEINIPANSSHHLAFWAGYKSKFLMSGDFDVQVDYSLLDWPTRNGIRVGIMCGENELTPPYEIASSHRVSLMGSDPAEFYTTVVYNSAGGSFYNRIASPDLSGKLRLERINGRFTGYCWDVTAQQWIEILSQGNHNQNLPIYLIAWSADPDFAHVAVRVAFDNFRAILYRNVSGRITLQNAFDQAQPLTFEFRPTDGSEVFTRTLTLNPDRTYTLTGIPAGIYNVWIKGERWLAKVLTVDVSSGSATGVNAALKAGDANNDNSADVLDLDLLIQAFDTSEGDAGFIPGADFDADGFVDVLDLDLLLRNFDETGDA